MNKEILPREKLIKFGIQKLKNYELLSIIFNTGVKNKPVLELSKEIVSEYGEDNLKKIRKIEDVFNLYDLPIYKSSQLIALVEFGRRLFSSEFDDNKIFNNPKKVFMYLKDLNKIKKEKLIGLYLNSRNKLIYEEIISVGSINQNIIHAREVFKPAIEYSASFIILVQNYPSGECIPSESDLKNYTKLQEVSKIIGIDILDHLIISDNDFISLKNKIYV